MIVVVMVVVAMAVVMVVDFDDEIFPPLVLPYRGRVMMVRTMDGVMEIMNGVGDWIDGMTVLGGRKHG